MNDPHREQPVLAAGAPLDQALAVVVLLHGRGASARDILSLAREIDPGGGVAYLAPQAAGSSWYPMSFLAPIEQNEPGLSSGLDLIGALLQQARNEGVPEEKHVLLGFSQGACLTLEYTVRNPRRFGGVIGFTGGLIGPPGTSWSPQGSLDETPVFLGSSDPDPHVPWERVVETSEILGSIGGSVSLKRYTGMGHTVNDDELAAARTIVDDVRRS